MGKSCTRGWPSPKMGLSSGWWAPGSTGFPHYVSVVGSHLYQCSNWHCCERLSLASVDFFGRLFERVCPFHDGWFASSPVHTTLSVQLFLTQNCTIPYSPDLTPSDFSFVSLDEKVLRGKGFANVEEVKKNGRSTKRHQNRWVQKLFWAVEKTSRWCTASNGEYFEGDWSLNM